MKQMLLVFLVAIALLNIACDPKVTTPDNSSKTNTSSDKKDSDKKPETTVSKDGYVDSEDGTEKEKPEAGKGNVQGKALYNEKPAANVEVKLCENFTTFSGCGGKQYTTKTDANGEYLIKNVDPKDYSGLIVKVFETPSYIFASRSFGIMSAKYKIEADKTFFAPATNLFKSDLKLQSPKNAAKVELSALEVKWDAYPDAAYYKLSFFAKNAKVTSPYINEKVEGTSFKPEKPLVNGEYNLRLEAYNANDIKLSTLKEDLKFNVTGSTDAPAETSANANQ